MTFILLTALKEVLEENGDLAIAQEIPWINVGNKERRLRRTFAIIFISFPIINLVEINGAVQNRRDKRV